VFEHLIESKHEADKKSLFSVGTVSVVVHTALIAAAVYATLGATETDSGPMMDTTMVYLNQPQQHRRRSPPISRRSISRKNSILVITRGRVSRAGSGRDSSPAGIRCTPRPSWRRNPKCCPAPSPTTRRS
jgi:hypothetical protein